MEVDAAASPSPKSSKSTAAESSNDAGSIMAAPGTQGSVAVAIHPLVIMNISEHWTRTKAQTGSPQLVVGALIGKQKGRNVEVMNSFELTYIVTYAAEGHHVIDKDFFTIREAQYKEVFKELEFLGWYSTGDSVTDADVHLHKQFCDINESPIMVKLNPQAKHQDKLPITVYESVIDLVEGQAKMLFVQLTYTLASEDAERIGIDHVARLSKAETGENSVASENMMAHYGAIKMLFTRVKLVLEYLNAVQTGELPKDDHILREIGALCCRLPVMDTERFRSEFTDQCNDVSLMTYLGTLTKMCSTLNQLVNKFNIVYDRSTGGRRTKGMFF